MRFQRATSPARRRTAISSGDLNRRILSRTTYGRQSNAAAGAVRFWREPYAASSAARTISSAYAYISPCAWYTPHPHSLSNRKELLVDFGKRQRPVTPSFSGAASRPKRRPKPDFRRQVANARLEQNVVGCHRPISTSTASGSLHR